MKKLILIVSFIVAAAVIAVYINYALIFKKLSFKFSGFNFNIADADKNFLEKLALKLTVTNDSNRRAEFRKVNVQLLNSENKIIGEIKPIQNVELPPNSKTEIPVQIINSNVDGMINDIGNGNYKEYKYRIKVVFLGFFYFQFTQKIFN